MTESPSRILVDEFVRRLKAYSMQRDVRFAFFLGAGCSVSSGIPGSAALVRDRWLPRLRDFCVPDQDLDVWVEDNFPETERFSKYDSTNPAASYGRVMDRLFPYPAMRQREVEDLCDGKFPSFGYAVLASLMAMDGGHFNVALTTNFDDLIPDALYLFTKTRPLVIHHESLGRYIRPTRTRPIVVKLHGDHRLSPLNTVEELGALNENIETPVRVLMQDRGLIFLGYGGHDEGIKKMLEAIPSDAPYHGVYWVSGKQPPDTIREWLESRKFTWVEHRDFDELMVLVRDEFKLPHPTVARIEQAFEGYKDTYDKLSEEIQSRSNSDRATSALKAAAQRTDESVSPWWNQVLDFVRDHPPSS